MERFGYHGKILHLNLKTRQSWIEEPEERLLRLYGGGDLLTTYYLLRECPPQIDAFDPVNLLILTSSVIAGQPYAGLSRYTAAAKSPLTGGIGETRGEGPFGFALKGNVATFRAGILSRWAAGLLAVGTTLAPVAACFRPSTSRKLRASFGLAGLCALV